MNHFDQITLNVMKHIIGEDYLKYIAKPVKLEQPTNNLQNEVNESKEEKKENTSEGKFQHMHDQISINNNEPKEIGNENEDYDEDFVDINEVSYKK